MLFQNKQPTPPLPSTQEHVIVQDVLEHVLVLKTGDLAAVLEVEGIDFFRGAESEQTGLVARYEAFLETVRWPYQITIARQRQRLEVYFAYLDQIARQYTSVDNAAYARNVHGWAQVMKDAVEQINPQIPQYLWTLPYDPIPTTERAAHRVVLTRERLTHALAELKHRCEFVITGLARLGLGSRRLSNPDLMRVLHLLYHPAVPDYRVPPLQRLGSLINRAEVRVE